MPSETSTACADQSVEELRRELAAAMPKKTNVLRGGAAPMYDSHATRPICARCAEANARPNSRPRRFIALPHGILTEHELSYPTMFTRAIVGIPGFRPARHQPLPLRWSLPVLSTSLRIGSGTHL